MNYERINQLIKTRGISKATFYDKIGMTRSGFILMRKKNSIKISILEKIAEALDVPVGYFFQSSVPAGPESKIEAEFYWKGRYDELFKAMHTEAPSAEETHKKHSSLHALKESVIGSGRSMTADEISDILYKHEPNSIVFYITCSGNAYIRTLYELDKMGNPVFFNWKALGRVLKEKKLNPSLLIDKSQYTYCVFIEDISFVLPDGKLKKILKDHYRMDETGTWPDLTMETAG